MRLSNITAGEYTPETNTLRIDGQDESGAKASVEIEVKDRDTFAGWINFALFERAMSGPSSQTGMFVKAVQFSTHSDVGFGCHVGFTFEITAGGTLRLILPIAQIAKTRLDAIQAHLEQALREMGATEKPIQQ
jgi:hypothetical protein